MHLEYSAPPVLVMDTKTARPLLIAEYGNFCFRCGYVPDSDSLPLTVDHIVPIARGGQDVYANYALLCGPCNSWKGTKIIDFRPGTRSIRLLDDPAIIPLWERSRQKWTPLPPADDGMRWVSFSEAQQILGTSEGTLRRMIRDGKVRAEQRRRNPESDTDMRVVYQVLVAAVPLDEPITTEPPAATTRALEVLAEALESERTERQRLSVENAELRERVGRAEARADAASARAAMLETALARERRRSWLRPWTW